jgi:hypothetical protein
VKEPSDNPFETPEVQDDEPLHAEEGVEVAAPLTLAEAEVLKAALRGSGIKASLRDHHTVAANSLLGAVVGGVKVIVPAEDEERAKEVLAARKDNDGRPVFRVVRRPYGAYGFIGLVAGIIADLPFDALGAFAVLGPLAGMGIGIWRASVAKPYCASCGARVDEIGSRCNGCGGNIAGNIGHPNERLAAEESLRE